MNFTIASLLESQFAATYFTYVSIPFYFTKKFIFCTVWNVETFLKSTTFVRRKISIIIFVKLEAQVDSLLDEKCRLYVAFQMKINTSTASPFLSIPCISQVRSSCLSLPS